MNWYEQLDFDENPFEDPENARLVGYEEIVNEVLYNIDAGNIIFIQAPPGSGKTAILRRAIQQFKGEGKVAYIDSNKVKDLNIERVLEKASGLLGTLFHSKPKGMIILVDNISDLSKKNSERLKYFYDQNYVKAIVFTGESINNVPFTPSLLDRVKKVITLPTLTEDYASTILKDRLRGLEYFPEDVSKEVFVKSKRNLKSFMNNAEALLKKALENKHENITFEDVRVYFGEHEPVRKIVENQKKTDQNPEPPKKVQETVQKQPEIKKAPPKRPIIEEEIKVSPQKQNQPQDIAERYY